jgi:hypothetical protein
MPVTLRDVADVSLRHGLGAIPAVRAEHRHADVPLDEIMPFVGGRMPVKLRGNFRTAGMVAAQEGGELDVIGLGRPLIAEPRTPSYTTGGRDRTRSGSGSFVARVPSVALVLLADRTPVRRTRPGSDARRTRGGCRVSGDRTEVHDGPPGTQAPCCMVRICSHDRAHQINHRGIASRDTAMHSNGART